MNDTHILTVADEIKIESRQVRAVATLIVEGATVPFIARYRKEATGSLDEVAVTAIRDRLNRLEELDSRKTVILKSLEQNGHLTAELKESVLTAETLAVLEDIYLPFRPKRRTKATAAREKGLEPLATAIFEQTGIDPEQAAIPFVDAEKEVETVDAAVYGARDIIAEMINEDARAREKLRALFAGKGTIRSRVSTGKEEEAGKYRNYFQWEEPVSKAPSHRILAMRRGEKEDLLNLTIEPPEEMAIRMLEQLFVTGEGKDAEQVKIAIADSYKRLLSRSMETETRLAAKERADTEAIVIFSKNLRQLMLSAPLGPKRVLGIDPGFRTGCKTVCLDAQGKLLHHETIYPHHSEKRRLEASKAVKRLCVTFEIEAIGVGNGTAGRETEAFIASTLTENKIPVVLVNESGASVYSASEAAREEFPDLDLTIRGAVSIGRRLMDPLSELVKIDPKSIGVGQYQHDVDQSELKSALDDVVVSCVNSVGVDLNRASVQLLAYVSGLGPQLAKNIVDYRDNNGPFITRNVLKKVHRLGPKAFEQSAGFLRIPEGEYPLDASAVHPESYDTVEAMAEDLKCTVADLMKDPALRKQIDTTAYVTDKIGLPTLNDILQELEKPGRDPRQTLVTATFAENVNSISDLTPGMKLPGVVTNVTAFGAFVDLGVHQDGLIHISELADRFVKNPSDVVTVNQQVEVTVLDVDLERNRISLSMKTSPGKPVRPRKKPVKKTPEKSRKPDPKPFHNPFASLLK